MKSWGGEPLLAIAPSRGMGEGDTFYTVGKGLCHVCPVSAIACWGGQPSLFDNGFTCAIMVPP